MSKSVASATNPARLDPGHTTWQPGDIGPPPPPASPPIYDDPPLANQAFAKKVANPILNNSEFQIVDTSETLKNEFLVLTALPNVGEGALELGEYLAGRGLVEAGGEAMTTLYRGVKPEELADIEETGQFVNRGSAEGKYFAREPEGVSSYARQAVKGFGDPAYTMVKTQIPTRLLTPEMGAVVDNGINAVVLPNELLPGLTPTVSPFMVVP